MLELSRISLVGVVGRDDPEYLARLMRVFRWCNSIGHWGQGVLFTVIEPPPILGLRVIQIPNCDKAGWEVLYARTIPNMLLEYDYTMAIHEDGFPTNPELWTPDFLGYDYIGAPWHDGVVGCGAMALTSREFQKEAPYLPWFKGDTNADAWYCRDQRAALEMTGLRFAPTDLADRYCTESMRNDVPSFGFHGRRDCKDKYVAAWLKIEVFEQENGLSI